MSWLCFISRATVSLMEGSALASRAAQRMATATRRQSVKRAMAKRECVCERRVTE